MNYFTPASMAEQQGLEDQQIAHAGVASLEEVALIGLDFVLVNNRAERCAPLTVQALVDQLRSLMGDLLPEVLAHIN